MAKISGEKFQVNVEKNLNFLFFLLFHFELSSISSHFRKKSDLYLLLPDHINAHQFHLPNWDAVQFVAFIVWLSGCAMEADCESDFFSQDETDDENKYYYSKDFVYTRRNNSMTVTTAPQPLYMHFSGIDRSRFAVCKTSAIRLHSSYSYSSSSITNFILYSCCVLLLVFCYNYFYDVSNELIIKQSRVIIEGGLGKKCIVLQSLILQIGHPNRSLGVKWTFSNILKKNFWCVYVFILIILLRLYDAELL